MYDVKLTSKKKMRNTLFVLIIILVLLLVRVGYIQFIQGEELSELAYEQQTSNRSINPERGTIYDATGKNILAISCTVETVTVNPNNISKEDKEKVATALANIFELDYETVLKKVSKNSSIETIVKKVEKSKTDELREWMSSNNITTGINIDEDTKRYYPYNNLAAQVIGFCGSDNQGLDGIEAEYEEELKGSKGTIKVRTNATGEEISGEGETYISAIDGNDLVLTIDLTIQSIVEKYLEEACIENECTDGGNVIVMNPNTGDILAMATYPSYNLNEPFEAYTDDLKAIWDELESSEKTTYLQSVWRNKAIADTYEPGSVFKLITASAALEEKITDTDNEGEFTCTGGIEISGVRIKCWRYYKPHGSESLRQALMNSCNPVFIGLGQKIGVQKYYEYLKKFNLLEKTGIDLPGEAGSIFLKEESVGALELATISFGQRFEITPLQLITAISTIANDGVSVTPRVVKQIVNSETNEVKNIEVEEGTQVISKETSEKVLSMMESVVSEGTGKKAKVEGYSIGGKTGTSEDGVNTGKYIASFCGVAPTDDPQIVVLVTLYNPTGEAGHQGGGIAAPVAGQIFSEVLPYLDVKQASLENTESVNQVSVPNIVGLSVSEAEQILSQNNLTIDCDNIDEIDKDNTYVKNQLPVEGTSINEGCKVIVEVTE